MVAHCHASKQQSDFQGGAPPIAISTDAQLSQATANMYMNA
jgi:hypothetical protein